MNTYNKEDFVASSNLREYAQSFGHGYDTMAKTLKADGLLDEWMNDWNKRNFEDLMDDEEEQANIELLVKSFSTVHSICSSSKYSFKSVRAYLDYKKYTNDETEDKDEDRLELREQLAKVIDEKYIDKRKTFYRRYRSQAHDRKTFFNDKHEELGMILYANNYKSFTYRGIKIELQDQPAVKTLGKATIVKRLGAVKAKEIFPELFDMKTKTSVTYKQFNDGVK